MPKHRRKTHSYTERSTDTVYTVDQIQAAVRQVADAVNRAYAGEELVLIPVLTGALVFAADLLRRLDKPSKVWVEVASVVRQGGAQDGTPDVKVELIDPANLYKHILIVEDIVDTGRTLNAVVAELCRKDDVKREELAGRIAAAILIRGTTPATLAIHEQRIHCGITHQFKEKLVGYGLDDNGLHRNRPEIRKLLK